MKPSLLIVKLDAETANSTLQRLNAAMLDVQADKGRYAKLADAFAAYWTPLVMTRYNLEILL